MSEEKLIEIGDEPIHWIDRSQNIGALGSALAKAQKKIKTAKKSTENAFFHRKYADLEAHWDACRDALSENELAVFQAPVEHAHGVGVITYLIHSSGEFIAFKLPLRTKVDDPQGIGSAITYGRRYSLAAAVGIAPAGEDDDGEAAMARGQEPPREAKGLGKKGPEHYAGVVQAVLTQGEKVAAVFQDRVCVSSVEPHRSSLLGTEGKTLNLLVFPTGKRSRSGNLPLYTVHMVTETKTEGGKDAA